MNLLILCAIVIVLAWLYIWVARPWLANRYPKVWQWVDTAEAWLIDRSRTLLIARLYWVGGIVICIHDKLAEYGMDWTPLVNQFTDLVPETYRPLALAGFLALTGIAFEWLRHVTREPLPRKVG